MDIQYTLDDIKQALDTGDHERVLSIFQSVENAMEECHRKMEETEQLRMEFLATVSHELRTPLNAIIGYNSLLEEGIYGGLNDKQMKAVHRIDRNSTRLLALVNQLLDLSRLEAGAVSVFLEKTDVNHLINEVLDDYQAAAEEKGLSFQVTQPHGGLYLVTDGAKLREMIRQLISNAVKFTTSGVIKVSAQAQDQGVMVEIEDTGPGIPEDQREAVFGLFRQCDSSYTRRHEGAGLGLAIVKRLANLLHIQPCIESEIGKGTLIRLCVNCAGESAVGTKANPPSHSTATLSSPATATEDTSHQKQPTILPVKEKTQSVLIVDDDPYTVEILSEFLESKGNYQVHKAYSGMHAMIELAKQKPDYLLVDLLMPQINGERVIQYCRELWKDDQVKIILITGKTLDQSELKRLETITHAVLKKGDLRPKTLAKTLEPYIQFSSLASA